jgi:Hint domain
MTTYSLTTGIDTIVMPSSGGTVYATAATLNAGDSLTGGGGTDILELIGAGTFRVDQLAAFTGFRDITLDNATSSYAFLTLGSQPVEVDVTGNLDIYAYSPSGWNGSDIINGDTSQSFNTTGVFFYNQSYPSTPVTYDLTSNTFSHVGYIYGDSDNVNLAINSSDTSGIHSFSALGSNDTLTTASSTLDLSHTTVSGFRVVSTNGLGTTFTVGDLGTALQIEGGPGHDTLVAQGFTLTADQRTAIFENSSIETIVDSSGTYQASENAPCYCSGTLIDTDCGTKEVEKLKIGDLVTTKSGDVRPIKWIGRRSYGGRFVLGRKDILPICIKAGALDENVPRRDLWISPRHAMYFDGVLIEAKDLVNGISISQTERVDKVEYFHIELDTHDVIVAEGALSETFIDDDSRGMFHNAHEYVLLYSDDARRPSCYCAPRIEDGYELEVVRQRTAQRAGLTTAKRTANADGALRGYIDLISVRAIEGWAQNLDHPDASVCLTILAGGRVIGQVLANRYREDLKRAGIGNGRHAFEFVPPPGIPLDCIQVRRSLDSAALLLSAHGKRDRLLCVA